MSRPVLSIIIPIYNTPKDEFEKCINSTTALNSYFPIEIIVIDDGSSDNLSLEYSLLCSKNENIKYYKTNNKGVSLARNLGIEMATGKYLLFLDSDDELIVENIKKDLLSKNYDIICYNMIIKNKKNYIEKKELSFDKSTELNVKEVLKDSIKNETFRSLASKFYKSDIIKKNNIMFNPDIIHGEDAIFNLEFLRKSHKAYFEKIPIYKYNFETSHYDKRWKKNPNKLMDNFKIRFELTSKIINDLKMYEKLKKYLYNEAIKETFRMLLINANTKSIKTYEIKCFVNDLSIGKKELNNCNKIKLAIINNNNKFIIWLLSIVRKIYLRVK